MKTASMGGIATFTNGGTPARSKPEFYEGDIPWITGADIADDQSVSARSFITEAAVRGSATSVLPPGTIVLVTRTSVGKVGVLREPTAFSQDITGITVADGVDPSYVVQFLRMSASALARQARGATIKGVTRDAVASLRLPVPPLDEQRRIAAILDHADALRAKRRQVLAYFDALTQSIFHDMFGDIAASATVEDVATQIRTGPFGSQLLHSEFVAEGIAVLGLDNVVGNEFRWAERRFISPAKYEQLRRYTVRPGDVLISIMGTTGRCVVVPGDIPTSINTKHICAIRADRERLDPTFLRAAFLWHPESRAHLSRQTKGSIMDGLNMGIIKAMPVPEPPLSHQDEFARKAAGVNAGRTAVLAAQSADDDLFASLQSRAFRGDL